MNKLNDIVTLSGLLLTLCMFLFNIIWPNITDALRKDDKISGKFARSKAKREINEVLILKTVPITIGFAVLFYVNLPTTINIIFTCEFTIWEFDVSRTLFVFIELVLLILIIFNSSLIIKLIRKSLNFR